MMTTAITRTDFQLGYVVWKSYDNLQDWANAQLCSIKELVQDFYLQVFAIYDYHYLTQCGLIKKISDIPKKIKQVFNNRTYVLKRYAGFANERHPEMYQKLFECQPHLELQYFGRTFTQFFTAPFKASIDVPIPGTHFRAHFFKDYRYYVFVDYDTSLWKHINYYAQLVTDFLTIELLNIKDKEVRNEYKITGSII